MRESDILYRAIENLELETGASIEVTEQPLNNGRKWDALIKIKAGVVQEKFKVEVKYQVHQANMSSLVGLLQNEGILIAHHISQPGKDLLEKKGINYLDIAGNCYIKSNRGLFWKIKNKRAPKIDVINKHQAFHKNGVKLIFALMIDEKLINKPYRVQAEVANISASTVGGIHKDLKEAKFLFQLNKETKQLGNKKELLSQWVQAYHQKLKPKLFRERYRALKNGGSWQHKDLGNIAFWGGEPAADMLTNFLHPEDFTLYTNLDRRELTNQLKLFPSPDGEIEVYSLFWKLENDLMVNTAKKTVHPLLVYADLLGTGDNRNYETAMKIYERYLEDIFN